MKTRISANRKKLGFLILFLLFLAGIWLLYHHILSCNSEPAFSPSITALENPVILEMGCASYTISAANDVILLPETLSHNGSPSTFVVSVEDYTTELAICSLKDPLSDENASTPNLVHARQSISSTIPLKLSPPRFSAYIETCDDQTWTITTHVDVAGAYYWEIEK